MVKPSPSTSYMTVHDLLQLSRPGQGLVSPQADRALWSDSQFDFKAAEGKGRTTKTLYIIDTLSDRTTPRTLLSNLAFTEAAWLDNDTILYLRPALPANVLQEHYIDNQGHRQDHPVHLSNEAYAKQRKQHAQLDGGNAVELWAKDVNEASDEDYLVARLPVEIANIKVTHISSSDKEQGAILTFSAEVYSDGDIYNVAEHQAASEKAAQGSDARGVTRNEAVGQQWFTDVIYGAVYDSLFVRHWDTWKSTDGLRQQVHFVRLTRNPDNFSDASSSDEFEHVQMPSKAGGDPFVSGHAQPSGRWVALMDKDHVSTDSSKEKQERVKVRSPLAGIKLECPVGPFGGADDFAVSSTHLVFHSKDPHVNPAWHTRTQVYILPLSPRSDSEATPRALTVGTQGACSSPTISADGKRIAWLEMREDGYEADRNRVMIHEIATGKRWGATEKWDRSPSKIQWCPCGEKLYLVAEDGGFSKLFQLAVPVPANDDVTTASFAEPEALTHDGTVSSFTPTSTSSLLLAINSLKGPNELFVLSLKKGKTTEQVVEGSPPATSLGRVASFTSDFAQEKQLSDFESFYFAGAEGVQVHGFILFPPGARSKFGEHGNAHKGKKYPMAFLVHGGPQGAWTDSWSTRWNPQTYAAAGFITVAINPTGSTGYGQEFCDRIKGQWGGYPYQDLLAGLEFVKEAYPEIDASRTCMLGASYGGYMAAWMQGHNDQLGFKAFVCHDGVFSTPNVWYNTEELYFPAREFGGTPWEVPEAYAKWNPQNFVHHWRTPMLVVSGGKDFRLPEVEGLAMFNSLQRLGVPSKYVYFESENHWVLKPHNSNRWHKEVLEFITEWTAEDDELQPTGSGYNVANK